MVATNCTFRCALFSLFENSTPTAVIVHAAVSLPYHSTGLRTPHLGGSTSLGCRLFFTRRPYSSSTLVH